MKKELKLSGKNQRSKQIIKRFGDIWIATKIKQPICCGGKDSYWCHPPGTKNEDMWVEVKNDPDFKVE